jgi:hypothetical protein
MINKYFYSSSTISEETCLPQGQKKKKENEGQRGQKLRINFNTKSYRENMKATFSAAPW